jgi:hypothetical protein
MHAGDGSSTNCFTYADATPILDVSTGTASISISVAGRKADDAALSFARELLKNVQVFAAEVERLHAEQAAITALRHADKAA